MRISQSRFLRENGWTPNGDGTWSRCDLEFTWPTAEAYRFEIEERSK